MADVAQIKKRQRQATSGTKKTKKIKNAPSDPMYDKNIRDMILEYIASPIVVSTGFDFAALFPDGTVHTWGGHTRYRELVSMPKDLSGVARLDANDGAFVAVKDNKQVVIWGSSHSANPSDAVRAALARGVEEVCSSGSVFIARLVSGEFVHWGTFPNILDSYYLSYALKEKHTAGLSIRSLHSTNIKSIYCAYAALFSDGSIVTFGLHYQGGFSMEVQNYITTAGGVTAIYASDKAFVAKLKNGRIIAWGDSDYGGYISQVIQSSLATDVVESIHSTTGAFAARMKSGRVVTWGNERYGGDSSSVQELISQYGVAAIFTTERAFAAKLLNNNGVVTWGYRFPGDEHSVQEMLKLQVDTIHTNSEMFVAKLINGDVVTWGHKWQGDVCHIQKEISDAVSIHAGPSGFVAILRDGSVYHFGGADPYRWVHCREDLKKTGIAFTDTDKVYLNNCWCTALRRGRSLVTWTDVYITQHLGGDNVRRINDILRDKGARWKNAAAAACLGAIPR